MHQIKTIPPAEHEKEFINLLDNFFSFSLPKVYNARSLAIELAKRTRFLRDEVIAQEVAEEEKKGFILGFYEAFRKYLISGLTKEEFADLYSQTVTYGLFAARTRSENSFNRKLAYDFIPHTIGILRDVFKFISLGDLPQQMEWIIDDISEVLAVADVKKILHQFFHEGKGKDPIVHFYETFLSEYDPRMREKRGVYYTPEPVVSYIVRSLHYTLKEHFERADGLASDPVTVLDPAAGTLTFLAEAAKVAVDEFVAKYGEGGRENFIREHILKNFYAFELMMAPYAVGHLKVSFLLEELGYKLTEKDRFKFYLTNTLEMEELAQTELPGMASLSEESHEAGKVKKEQPILVILGNPPYSVSSANKSDFIEKEMELYKEDVRKEKNIQPLSDDYIKFIRFAHWKIDQVGKGIIGMITNNSYLSGLIHRGMRKKLLGSFNEIYILNLHGNSRIGEKCPDGSPDENVFDIMQGVSIALFIKSNNQNNEPGKVYYRDIYGLRENKYKYLNDSDIKTTEWKELQISDPYYFFVPKDFSLQYKYDKFIKLTNIFNKWGSGIKTNRDHFLVDQNKSNLIRRIEMMVDTKLDDDLISTAFQLKDGKYWNTKREREKIRNNKNWKNQFFSYSYRPFDIRWIYYQPNLIEIGRGGASKSLMRNFFWDNLGLVTIRSEAKQVDFSHSFLSNCLADVHYIGGQTYIFPLYLYPDSTEKGLFLKTKKDIKQQLNLKCELIEIINNSYNEEPTPKMIFNYIYVILYSNIYRTKYDEFLKIDFPRIPFTKN
jgi:predicted helicase